VAIAYSAMTNPRPYAKTLTPTQALTELQRCAGSQFDPAVVAAFVRMI
jgi:two-component system, cell cycle response regulator